MKQSITNYRILKANSIQELEEKVKDLIIFGWLFSRGVTYMPPILYGYKNEQFLQTMYIKPE